MTFMIDLHTRDHGYEEVWVPFVVNRASMTGTAQFPKFEDEQYGIVGDDLFLVPTAEVPVTNLYRDEILDAVALPTRVRDVFPVLSARSRGPRQRHAGTAPIAPVRQGGAGPVLRPGGFSGPARADDGHAEAVLQRLGLPYRVVLLAAGDTGFASAKTFDLEVWAPGVAKWLEVSSCSTCTDFSGPAREHPLPSRRRRQADLHSHVERIGDRLSAADRGAARAVPGARWRRARARRVAARARRGTDSARSRTSACRAGRQPCCWSWDSQSCWDGTRSTRSGSSPSCGARPHAPA